MDLTSKQIDRVIQVKNRAIGANNTKNYKVNAIPNEVNTQNHGSEMLPCRSAITGCASLKQRERSVMCNTKHRKRGHVYIIVENIISFPYVSMNDTLLPSDNPFVSNSFAMMWTAQRVHLHAFGRWTGRCKILSLFSFKTVSQHFLPIKFYYNY